MEVVPSTLQLTLGVVLLLFGVCGNLAVPFVSYRTTLRCPHITVLAVLDFIVALLGPGLMLLTTAIGPTWLEHNITLCQSLSFVSSWALITSFLVLFFLAVCCQKLQHRASFLQKLRSKRRGRDFPAIRLLTGLLLAVDILLGWSVFSKLHLVPPCNLLIHVQSVSKNSAFYLASSFTFLSITIFLAARGMREQCRLYPVQMFWERHEYEVKMNDPEMTTVASISSSNQSKTTIWSNRSYWSRRSSGWRSAMLSVTASPLVSRRASQQPRLQESMASLDQQALLNVALLSFNGRGAGEDAGKKLGDMTYHVSALEKNAKRKPRSASSPQQPFVISSGIPFNFPMLPIGRKVFKNPWSLPHFEAVQHQRSLSRLLLLKSCVTILCWLPLYVAFALQLSSVKYQPELHFFIHWLIFLPSSISPFFSLCGANFSRRILRRAAYYVLKTCACDLHEVQFQTAKSDDEIEGARLLACSTSTDRNTLTNILREGIQKKNLYITD